MRNMRIWFSLILLGMAAACRAPQATVPADIATETRSAVVVEAEVNPPTATPRYTKTPTVTPTVTPTLSPTQPPASLTPTASEGVSRGLVLMAFGDRFIVEIYTTVRPALEAAGYRVVVASRQVGEIKGKNKDFYVPADLLLEDVQVEDYDAVIFGCDNDLTFGSAIPETNRIAQQAVAAEKVVGAICSGPRVLAYAQVVAGKRVTGEPSQTCQMLEQAGGTCTGERVERDGWLVTAKDRFAAPAFADTILEALEERASQAADAAGEAGLLAFYSDRDGNPEIYTMRADGGQVRRLTDNVAFDDSPAISPDGTRIVFLTARHDPAPKFPDLRYEIYAMDSEGSNIQRLTDSEAGEDHPAWSPDGGKISFDADYDGDGFYEIYSMNPDGTEVQRLTFTAANDQFADWSPDGERIAFASDRNGNWDIFVMDRDGSHQVALTGSPDWELFPAWSPDGRQMAYTGLAPRSRNTDVYLMDADGGRVRQLTDEPGFDENPAWSPDGKQIAFQTNRDGNFEIYAMALDGSQQHPLAVHRGDDLWPSWGASGPKSGAILFEKSEQTFASVPTWKIGLTDLDADGDLDAVFANAQSNDSEVWLNDGNGAFTDSGQDLGKYGHGVAVGDVDGDGDPDVVITTHEYLPTRVYLNDGQAVFQELEGAFAETTGHSVDLFDLDGDGDLDAAGEGSGVVSIFWNDGNGRFITSGLAFPERSAWGDLDSDGDVDLLIKEDSVGYTVHLNDGRGNFAPYWAQADPAAMGIGDMALGDIDADGDLDAVITNGFHQTTSYPTRIFVNDGTGQFADSGQQLSAVASAGASLGDVDGDGDLDLVLTDYLEVCQIWLNDSRGRFMDSGFRFGGGQFYRHAHLGDLDGDGDLDIFLATFGMREGPNEIWFNIGD